MTWVNDNLLIFVWTIPLTNSCIGPLTMAYVCQKGSLLCCIIRHFHWNLWSKQKKHFLHIIWSKPQNALTLNLNVLQEIPVEARLSKLIKLHHLNHQMERKHAPRIQPDGYANWVWTSNKQRWCLWASTWPIKWLYEDGGGLRWHIFMEGDWTDFYEGRKDSEQRRANLRRRWEEGRRSDASVWAWIWNVASLSVSRVAPDEPGPMGRPRFLVLFPGTPTSPGSPATGNLKRVHPAVNATNNYDETLRGANT